jgi:hypothetical protein
VTSDETETAEGDTNLEQVGFAAVDDNTIIPF